MLNKNIRLLAGKPLVSYTIEMALQCRGIDDFMVSTDSAAIMEIAGKAGIRFVTDRPQELATDGASKWPVFIHAMEAYEKATGVFVDYIVDMDATAPLKTAADIEGAIETALSNPEADVVITAYESESNPYFNIMEIADAGFAKMSKKPDVPVVCRQQAPPVYSLSPSAFVIKKESLYRFTHWSEANIKLYIIPRERGVDIDTEMDFRFVEFLMQEKLSKQ